MYIYTYIHTYMGLTRGNRKAHPKKKGPLYDYNSIRL